MINYSEEFASAYEELQKAIKDRSHLTQRVITDKNGHTRKVWVKTEEKNTVKTDKKIDSKVTTKEDYAKKYLKEFNTGNHDVKEWAWNEEYKQGEQQERLLHQFHATKDSEKRKIIESKMKDLNNQTEGLALATKMYKEGKSFDAEEKPKKRDFPEKTGFRKELFDTFESRTEDDESHLSKLLESLNQAKTYDRQDELKGAIMQNLYEYQRDIDALGTEKKALSKIRELIDDKELDEYNISNNQLKNVFEELKKIKSDVREESIDKAEKNIKELDAINKLIAEDKSDDNIMVKMRRAKEKLRNNGN